MRICVRTVGLTFITLVGCTTSSGEQDDAAAARACAVFDREPEGETDCGTYEEHAPDPCEEGGGAPDTGADPAECDERRTANEAVVACITEAAAAHVPHTFTHRFSGSTSEIDWVVRVDGTGASWSTRVGSDDLCMIDEAIIHLKADLSNCSTWPCIADTIESAGVKRLCRDASTCDGV